MQQTIVYNQTIQQLLTLAKKQRRKKKSFLFFLRIYGTAGIFIYTQ